jgi:small-conductance mechanosensitive channel
MVEKEDRRTANFEERFDGEGVVELDALEALHPGLLEQLVREAVAQYRDPDLAEGLSAAEAEACQAAAAQWAEETADLREELDKLAAAAEQAAEPFRARLDQLHREFEQAVAPVRKRTKELEGELEELANDFDPELPERPEAEPPELGDEDPLFDSRRAWLLQLQRYRDAR